VEMAFRDGVVSSLVKIIREKTEEKVFLAQIAVECLSILSGDSRFKIQMINSGVLEIFPILCDWRWQSDEDFGEITVRNLLSNPNDYLYPEENSLKKLAGNYVCRHTDSEDYVTLLEIVEMHHLKSLQTYFTALIFNGPFTHHHFLHVHDPQLRALLHMLVDLKTRAWEVEEKLEKGEKVDKRLCYKVLQFFVGKNELDRVRSIRKLMMQNGMFGPGEGRDKMVQSEENGKFWERQKGEF